MSGAPHVTDGFSAAVRALNANRDSLEAVVRVRDALRRAGEVGASSGDLDEHLVVYGTLAPGRPNHHVVADIAGRWFTGWVEGDLHDHGWGAADGYPAMAWPPTTSSSACAKEATERETSSGVVAHEQTLTRMILRPFHEAPPTQHSRRSWMRDSVELVNSSVSQRTMTWLKTTSFIT